MTADRIVEFQRVAMSRQQKHLEAALLKLRTATAELEIQTLHANTMFSLLAQRDRTIAALRAELEGLRAIVAGEGL